MGTDAPKTLDITVTASNEGVFINNAEISAMTETDGDSTPNNDVAGEDAITSAILQQISGINKCQQGVIAA